MLSCLLFGPDEGAAVALCWEAFTYLDEQETGMRRIDARKYCRITDESRGNGKVDSGKGGLEGAVLASSTLLSPNQKGLEARIQWFSAVMKEQIADRRRRDRVCLTGRSWGIDGV